MTACLWTGAEFEPMKRAGRDKVFASNAARAEAHKAARLHTEWLIASGHMTWTGLRRWYDQRNALPATNTTRKARRSAQPDLLAASKLSEFDAAYGEQSA